LEANVSDFKELLQQKGMELLKDPRVQKLMQDERVTKGMMQALQLRGKVQDQLEKGVEDLAGALNLVTQKEMKDLRRQLKKMERELEQARAAAKKAKGE
jgi:hypothetical protein